MPPRRGGFVSYPGQGDGKHDAGRGRKLRRSRGDPGGGRDPRAQGEPGDGRGTGDRGAPGGRRSLGGGRDAARARRAARRVPGPAAGGWHGDPQGVFRTRAILAVPLLANGRVVGVLQLLNPVDRERFTDDDLRRMRLFASVLAHPLQNARLYAVQRRQFMNMVTALAETLEKKDPYTGGHVRRVVCYSLLLGAEMGLDSGDLKDLWLAAPPHGIRKIAVPDRLPGQ